jgi:hypothetical protein
MTTRQVYFICSTPGSSGNFVGRLVRSLIDTGLMELTPHTFSAPAPDVLTPEFFYANLTIAEEGNVVVNVPFRPDYNTLKSRFPGCKIIVLTHRLQDCETLARGLVQSYYIDGYEHGSAPYFNQIIQDHSHLFSSVDLLPTELTNKDRVILNKIVAYHKLLDGFYTLDVPLETNILELKFNDLYFNTAQVESQLELFTGGIFTESQKAMTATLTTAYINSFCNPLLQFLEP